MPCSDGGPSYEQVMNEQRRADKERKERQMIAAMLCAICTALESSRELVRRDGQFTLLPAVLDKVDWEEVGFTRVEFAIWWDQHKREDRARREREQAERQEGSRREAIRQAALSKLTPEERKELGV